MLKLIYYWWSGDIPYEQNCMPYLSCRLEHAGAWSLWLLSYGNINLYGMQISQQTGKGKSEMVTCHFILTRILNLAPKLFGF